MQFINFAMLLGLLAVAIPIIIQILTRKNARRIPWGAWLFLDKTMKKRKRKVLLEDILLLACRCLALGLLALAFARPFVRPDHVPRAPRPLRSLHSHDHRLHGRAVHRIPIHRP
ncbi:MAG: BatA domain-containing protein, partial [Kiritimatiellae bacterium]|nr:BatA domain-containing protein [Kiritimatiellia bacterium]